MIYLVIWLVIGFVSVTALYCLYRMDTEGDPSYGNDKTGTILLIFLIGTLGGLVTTVFTFIIVLQIIIRDFKTGDGK